MEKFGKYGKEPYNVAVIHGGPGAPGDVAQLASELSECHGVLEPLLSSESIRSQIEELISIFKKNGDQPLYLIGHSYGAWLSIIFTAHHPEYVKKLILVSSGPFEKKYRSSVLKTRSDRLEDAEKKNLFKIFEELSEASKENDENLLDKMDQVMSKTDFYEEIDHENEVIDFQSRLHQKVWDEAKKLREEGKLLEYADKIDCSVTAIHGDYDPHPWEGVKKPLSKVLDDFKFFLIEKCGHYPWYEIYAKNEFFKILEDEL
ncbi:MAG: alpha/beta fold hydrolase [Thermoplasmatota archaeon]